MSTRSMISRQGRGKRQGLACSVGCLVLAAGTACGQASGDGVDEALKGRDLGRLMELLSTGGAGDSPATAKESDDRAPVLEPAITAIDLPDAGRSPAAAAIRVPDVPGPGPTNRTEASSRPPSLLDPPIPAPPSESNGGATRLAVSEGATGGGGPAARRAVPVHQPTQVPLTRPSPTPRSPKVEEQAKPLAERPRVPAEVSIPPTEEIVLLPEGLEVESEIEPAMPEDRDLARAELQAVLSGTPASPAAAIVATGQVLSAISEELTDRPPEKPIGFFGRIASVFSGGKRRDDQQTDVTSMDTGYTPVDMGTAPPPVLSAVPRPGPDEPSGLRMELDQLLLAARQDAFGSPPADVAGSVSPQRLTGWRYTGKFRDGKMDGYGALVYPDGWRYEGEWLDSAMHGEGTLSHPDGWQYMGEWRDGKMDGRGVLIYPDGWKYVGDWRQGRMHGAGELVHPDVGAVGGVPGPRDRSPS